MHGSGKGFDRILVSDDVSIFDDDPIPKEDWLIVSNSKGDEHEYKFGEFSPQPGLHFHFFKHFELFYSSIG